MNNDLWRCEEALMDNCQRESCGGFNWHKFMKGQCDNNKKLCGNTESHWNESIPVKCVKRANKALKPEASAGSFYVRFTK